MMKRFSSLRSLHLGSLPKSGDVASPVVHYLDWGAELWNGGRDDGAESSVYLTADPIRPHLAARKIEGRGLSVLVAPGSRGLNDQWT